MIRLPDVRRWTPSQAKRPASDDDDDDDDDADDDDGASCACACACARGDPVHFPQQCSLCRASRASTSAPPLRRRPRLSRSGAAPSARRALYSFRTRTRAASPARSRSSDRDRRSRAFDRLDRRSVDRVPGRPSPEEPSRCAASRRDATPRPADWRPCGQGARATSGRGGPPRDERRGRLACLDAMRMFGAPTFFASSRHARTHFFSRNGEGTTRSIARLPR